MLTRSLRTTLSTACLCSVAALATADESNVLLQAKDNSLTIVGQIAAFDGEAYTLDTAVGQIVLPVSLVDCKGDGCPALRSPWSEFKIAGSRALADGLIPALLTGYSDAQSLATRIEQKETSVAYQLSNDGETGAGIEIAPSNTRDGLRSLLNDETTFALATRPVRNREAARFVEAEQGEIRSTDQEHIVALDGLLLVTHPENPVRAITELNAAFVFGGQIVNWKDLNGRDAPITLYVREDGSGTREVFDSLLMRPNGLSVAASVQVLDSDAAVAEAVLRDPNGIGFTSFANAEDAAPLAIEGVCGLRTPPTAFTIKTEEYPLTRLLYMYNTDEELPYHAQGFLDFLKTDQGQSYVDMAGFIDQRVSSETINTQGMRVASAIVNNAEPEEYAAMREMFSTLINADRLSTTFRFETGSAQLDSRAVSDVDRLSELLANPRFANKEVLFVGFTDSIGRADLNQLLSQQRAELVRSAVIGANPDLGTTLSTRSIGFGEASPLGCNETDNGRRINRRVEIWVQDVAAGDRT